MTTGPRITIRPPALVAVGIAVALGLSGCSGADDSDAKEPDAPATVRASGTVGAFPSPGARGVLPGTDLSFRGATKATLGTIAVTGASSGRHTGTFTDHRDRRGVTFDPDHDFDAGEVVTVKTEVDVASASHHAYSFKTAAVFHPTAAATTTSSAPGSTSTVPVTTTAGPKLTSYHSTDLTLPKVTIDRASAPVDSLDVFLTVAGTGVRGPMIVDTRGEPIWFKASTSTRSWLANLEMQEYQGKPVLTWFDGSIDLSVGAGAGEFVITDDHYREVARVHTGNGYDADIHDFRITKEGTALFLAYNFVVDDSSSVGGKQGWPVLDGVVQEVDIESGDVLFEWHSLGSIPFDESTQKVPSTGNTAWDFVHINSVEPTSDGALLVSARHTSTVYAIDRATGRIRWRLGGKASDFTMEPRTEFRYQHDARVAGDGEISIFDNGATHSDVQHAARGIVLKLDRAQKTAALVREYPNPGGQAAESQGSFRVLPDGRAMLGWGFLPEWTVFEGDGRIETDASLPSGASSYRAVAGDWVGYPTDRPAAAATRDGDRLTVYASWNGATEVARWRVVDGDDHGRKLGSARRGGFETTITIENADGVGRVAVEAVDARGKVLGTSEAVNAG